MTIGAALSKHYGNMMTSMPKAHVHSKMMAAKGSVIKSAIPKPIKIKMVNGYRSAEKHLFGSTTTLSGENELGVSGLNMGQRLSLRREGMAAANPPSADTGESDLSQALLSRYNASNEPN